MKKLILHFLKSQTREEGTNTITYKVLFGKMYITSQRVEESFYINDRAMKNYVEKISA